MSETTGVGELDFSEARVIYLDEIPVENPELKIEQLSPEERREVAEQQQGAPLGDNPEVVVVEHLVLNKYDGNLTEAEMATANPVERIVIQRGKVSEHYIRRNN